MWSAIGLLLDIFGFIILFYNGNFARNFNRLDGFIIRSGDSNGNRGGMQALESKRKLPKILDYVGFSAILSGFVFQLVGTVLQIWSATP
ncbi:hypothetical protein [Rhizobium sp. GR12]|uniref:hypothetical protein n=1 Tax=Rhizobium sp. GR12 TaxID=3053925 RepID=UPI002FBDF648